MHLGDFDLKRKRNIFKTDLLIIPNLIMSIMMIPGVIVTSLSRKQKLWEGSKGI